MALVLGITGGIGSGKSVVSRLMKVMGISIYDSDSEAKKVMKNSHTIREKLISLVGKEVVKDGEINKEVLTKYIFSNTENTKKVNAIIHPEVISHFKSWIEKNNHKHIIAVESALLFESDLHLMTDKSVVITTPLETRIKRAMQRDNSSREQVTERIKAQSSDDEKLSKADFHIINDDCTPLTKQVWELINLLKQK
ncbi:MAG: dephospho-CoA kinase [Bacteroides sp.]|nr:dephospho-CoA kinase [Bacteroides sp.]